LARFLILGSDGGTYYVDARKHTKANVDVVYACVAEDFKRTVDEIVAVLDQGRAKDNDPAILALAIVASNPDIDVRAYALAALPKVIRIGTHLFHFMEYMKSFKSMGRMAKRHISNWYLNKEPDQVAYQMVKYRQRDGWTHKDVIKLAHPATDVAVYSNLFRWAIGKEVETSLLPKVAQDYIAMDAIDHTEAGAVKKAIKLLKASKLPWEAVNTEFLSDPEVWKVLLNDLPVTATMRNLGRLTANGVLKELSNETSTVVNRLTDDDILAKGRVHPLSVLFALKTYESGQGMRGGLSWKPVTQVAEALEKAYYKSFKNVTPTGKKLLLALDVSGSMGSPLTASPVVSCAEAAAAMAMVTKAVEPNVIVKGFSHQFVDLPFKSSMSLKEALTMTQGMNFGRTDCSLPMVYATTAKLDVDAFIVYTDNETWHGSIHPMQALRDYRKAMNKPNAKLIVVGMTATNFSIADPDDMNCLDIVGFDASTPQVISEFVAD
jgi:60 kDa SS-A/Ro ribonucleoprotein